MCDNKKLWKIHRLTLKHLLHVDLENRLWSDIIEHVRDVKDSSSLFWISETCSSNLIRMEWWHMHICHNDYVSEIKTDLLPAHHLVKCQYQWEIHIPSSFLTWPSFSSAVEANVISSDIFGIFEVQRWKQITELRIKKSGFELH